jgi:hypothetical protein
MDSNGTSDGWNSAEAEAFFMAYHWFVRHVASLAMDAEGCCKDQGDFNVAHELWHFVPRERDALLADPLRLLSPTQRTEVTELCQAVAAVPEAAREWATTPEGSLENMRHPAWRRPRHLAQNVLGSLASITAQKDAFFAHSAL